jgi:hypothetical protein
VYVFLLQVMNGLGLRATHAGSGFKVVAVTNEEAEDDEGDEAAAAAQAEAAEQAEVAAQAEAAAQAEVVAQAVAALAAAERKHERLAAWLDELTEATVAAERLLAVMQTAAQSAKSFEGGGGCVAAEGSGWAFSTRRPYSRYIRNGEDIIAEGDWSVVDDAKKGLPDVAMAKGGGGGGGGRGGGRSGKKSNCSNNFWLAYQFTNSIMLYL